MIFTPETQYLVSLSPIDFRKGINKVATASFEIFKKDPKSGMVFVFRNKKKTDIKFIYYSVNGFLLCHKRLSKGKLDWWPRTKEEAKNLDSKQFARLLEGVDPRGDFHPDWKQFSLPEMKNEEKETHRHKPRWQGGRSSHQTPQV